MKTRTVLALCALVLTLAASARADEIQFTNGDKLTGKIVRLKDGKLGFTSKIAGAVTVNWADVATLTSDEPVTIELEGGSVIVDKLVAAEPGSVKTAGTDKVTSQTIVLANAAKLNPEPVEWKGSVLAGADIERGNTVKTAGTIGVDAVRRSESDRITFAAGYAGERTRAKKTEENPSPNDETTKRKLFGTLQYDYFFTKKLYGYANAKGEKDGVADLALRFAAGAGGGYQWYETDTFKWNTEGGLAWISENYTDDTPHTDYIAARIASNLEYELYPGLTFFQNTRLYPSLEDIHDQLIDTATGFRYKIWGDIFGESKVLWVYDTTPAEGNDRQDLSYILGIGYAF